MSRYFKILLRFKGFGDPKYAVWFVGIEEAYKWEKDPEQDKNLYEQYKKGWFPLNPSEIEKNRQYTQVYDIMSKIMVQLLKLTDTSWKQYRHHQLLQAKSKTFQSNLYPLGKPSTLCWPCYYTELFGVSKEEYLSIVRKQRFPMLLEFWRKSHPLLTICFGKSFWSDFQKLFLIDESQLETYDSFKFTKIGEPIIFIPFFNARFMREGTIANLVKLAKGLEIRR